ncbi:MAG TPA: hypothetical protein VGQ64_04735, partial [Candidatus Limnocylindrales bacterium]|nr:hypothetical protein [Candidatus Limnocylindrales bacterium]
MAVLAIDLGISPRLVVSPELAAYASLLAMGGDDIAALVERELRDNPALVRADPDLAPLSRVRPPLSREPDSSWRSQDPDLMSALAVEPTVADTLIRDARPLL